MFAKSGIYYLGASSPSKAQAQTCLYLKKEVKTIDDFKGLKIAASGRIKVKASGGICTLDQALTMIEAGATRLGTSASVAIINALPQGT